MDDPQISPECKGVVEPGRTELPYELVGVKISVKNVRASVCNKCGQSLQEPSLRLAKDVKRLLLPFELSSYRLGKTNKSTGV